MKKLFFLFAFMGLLAFTADAQKKACCAAGNKASCMASTSAAAEKAASADASIVKQVSNTGEVSYVRKEVSASTGKVTLTTVEYCTKEGKFINVSPTGKACCAKGASATKVSSSEKAGCCAKKGEKTTSTATNANEGQVKLVTDQSNN